jgi:hypothetical protein
MGGFWVAIIVLFFPDGSSTLFSEQVVFDRPENCRAYIAKEIKHIPYEIKIRPICLKVPDLRGA